MPDAADFQTLVRPRLAALGLAVVVLSYAVAGGGGGSTLAWLSVGSLLALFGASVMNQVLEKDTDALMRRTADRPLPAGRIGSATAAAVGLGLTAAGLAVLAATVGAATTVITAAGWVAYVAVYTPMKTRSGLATVVGAVPGAVPVLMGWSAATGGLALEAWSLFAILFLWQLPHFLAIAWMYRADYRRAGLRMLPGNDLDGSATARQVAVYGLALVPVSLLPSLVHSAGPVYFFGALILGGAYLFYGLRMGTQRTGAAARQLLRASVAYLPVLLILLVIDIRL
jgi:protoheme IX farnesyltransferase